MIPIPRLSGVRSRYARRRGFTLVEILVVIGIIALLIGILIPVIGKARRQASWVKCSANMGQLMVALTLYTGDNDGYLPTPGWLRKDQQDYPAGRRGSNWLYNEDARAGSFKLSDVEKGSFWRYTRKAAIYRCPDDYGPWPAGASQNITSYLMNGAVCAFDNQYPGGGGDILTTRFDQYKPDVVIIWEVTPFDAPSGNDSSSFPSEKLGDRHVKGSVAGCIDGHVESIPITLWQQYLNAPGRNRLWCNPYSANGQ